MRSGIKNSNLIMPTKRIALNLAPADIPKDGSCYDLPMTVAILAASQQIPQTYLNDSIFTGEISLNGNVRPVRGVINHVEIAKRHKLKRAFVPVDDVDQACLVNGIDIIPINNLQELVKLLTDQVK